MHLFHILTATEVDKPSWNNTAEKPDIKFHVVVHLQLCKIQIMTEVVLFSKFGACHICVS